MENDPVKEAVNFFAANQAQKFFHLWNCLTGLKDVEWFVQYGHIQMHGPDLNTVLISLHQTYLKTQVPS